VAAGTSTFKKILVALCLKCVKIFEFDFLPKEKIVRYTRSDLQ
jgi:hypothetical protein